MIEPNSFYRSSFKSTYLNISSGNEYEYAVFDSLDAKRIFGADWGATATVRPEKEFSPEYERCTLIYIFKRNMGEAYYFFLSNDSALLSTLPAKYAGTLTFNTSAGKNTK